jgi:hypothetical protein
MAAFFKVPASAGVVVRAEHVFARHPVRAPQPRIACRWTRDAEGRLSRAWQEKPAAVVCAEIEPLSFVTAA